ncbi:ricin-type beta-trefoil lectin protein [Micromonospora pisi]|uniref:Ricin-type beta-trefoil lectin protein n=1 Tax=Micromonospora pisi TaxID=589240 RepID=A0A495JPE5_9ACTN|nr:RICIN domain-containing protein [Micromonospora pisi]RKR90408.1 ricin-type beta-trefoil lectin protein [Micromonospora pisi]
MATSDEQHRAPGGTVYGSSGGAAPGSSGGAVYGGGPPPPRPGRDRLMTGAYAIGAAGLLTGLLFATGALRGDGGTDVDRAAQLPAPVASVDATTASPGGGAAGSTDPAPPPSPTPVEVPARMFHSVASSFCLAMTAGNDPSGAEVRQVVCTDEPNQRWRPTPVVGDQVTLVNVATGGCLEVTGASRDDGARVGPAVCDGSVEQRWRLAAADGGQISLVNLNSGRCLDVPTQTLDVPETGLQQWGCQGGSNQRWTDQPG